MNVVIEATPILITILPYVPSNYYYLKDVVTGFQADTMMRYYRKMKHVSELLR